MFVCFEGIDGAGKSTQAQLLHDHLKYLGYAVELVRDPGTTKLGQSIRQLILDCDDPITPAAQALLFSAARAELSAYIRQRLADKVIVICDRWLLSTLVYQGGISRQLILAIFGATCLIPDFCVLLDIDPEIANARQPVEKRKDRYERATLADKQARRGMYLHAAEELPACSKQLRIYSADIAEDALHKQIVSDFFELYSQQRSTT